MNSVIEGYLTEMSNILGGPVRLFTSRHGWLHPITEDIIPNEMGATDTKRPDSAFFVLMTDPIFHPRSVDNSEYWTGSHFAEFTLREFPGCCAFCVSTGARTYVKYRKRGINTIANKLRQQIARLWGYTALVCTDVEDNVPERLTLIKNGFQDIYKTVNRRTGNTIIISIKYLEV